MKKYSEPTNKDLYALLGQFKLLLKWLTRTGTLISGILTGTAVYFFLDYALWISIILSVLAPIVVEGLTHIFSALSVEIFFRAIGGKDKLTSWLLFCFFFVCLLFAGGANMFVSTNAGKHTAHTVIGDSKQDTATYTSSNLLLNNALDLFVADSLRTVTTTNSLKEKRKQELQSIINSAINKKEALRKSTWYNNHEQARKDEIKIQANKIKSTKKELKKVNTIYAQIAADSINMSRSRMLERKAFAGIDRLSEDSLVLSKNLILIKENKETKSKWSGIAMIIAIIGVLSALMWNIYIHGRNYLCGVKRIYRSNERELNEGFWYQLWEIMMDWLDIAKEAILDFFRRNEKDNDSSGVGANNTEHLADELIADFDDDTDNVISISQEYERKDINKLIERTKRQYKRRLTSIEEVARVRNEGKYKTNAAELRRLGYTVKPVPGDNTKLSILQKIRKDNIA